MIFVTVGTHEQPFNRLVEYIDKLKETDVIQEEVIIQLGYSTYIPKFCTWKNLYSYQEMIENVKTARIVITHGGPSSFIMPLQLGKIPIVVPRQKKYGEHVNDHQVDFVQEVYKRQNNIIPVNNMNDLVTILEGYDEIYNDSLRGILNNNGKFNLELRNIINRLFVKGI